jgi:type II secretory pathway pseudopilin PulG
MGVKKFSSKNGFTLLEAIIIFIIFLVVLAIVIPSVQKVIAKGKQLEAQRILQLIYTEQQNYKQTHGSYWISGGVVARAYNPNAFAVLGIKISPTCLYSYKFTIETATIFTCQAKIAAPGLDNDTTSDIWTINERGHLACESDDSVL